MDARSLLALANLEKHDRYQIDRAKLQAAKKEDWRWVGYDSTIGMGIVRSGNITRMGKVITNGYLVEGQPVEFNQDGQFGTIEGMPYVKPQPRSKPQYVPRDEDGLNVKIFYRLAPLYDTLLVGAWKPDSVVVTTWDSQERPQINYGAAGFPNAHSINFDNRGSDDWMSQTWRVENIGVNASGFPIQNISILETDSSSQQEINVFSSYEFQEVFPPPITNSVKTFRGMHAISVGGGYTLIDSSTRNYTLNSIDVAVTGEFKHVWERGVVEVQGTPETGTSVGAQFVSLSGKKHYLRPPDKSLKIFQSIPVSPGTAGWQPLATDGIETLARYRVNGVSTFYLVTDSQEIPIPAPNIPSADGENFQRGGTNNFHFPLKLIDRKLYFIPFTQFPVGPLNGSRDFGSIQSAIPGEEGTIKVRSCDLIAGTWQDEDKPLYKLPLLSDVIAFTYHP